MTDVLTKYQKNAVGEKMEKSLEIYLSSFIHSAADYYWHTRIFMRANNAEDFVFVVLTPREKERVEEREGERGKRKDK